MGRIAARVRVLHRAEKEALGRACAAGFRVALEQGATLVERGRAVG